MKKSRFAKVGTTIALSLATVTSLQATNGDNLIGIGAKTRSMGGTGIAISHGAESSLSNPASITSVEGTEVSFGGTIFMPNIKTGFANTTFNSPATLTKSDADINLIPEVSIAHKIDDNWYIGVGMWGTAGMGVDFSQKGLDAQGQNVNMHMLTNLQLLQFGIPIAYKTAGFSIAVEPIIQYGNLDIDYSGNLLGGVNAPTPPSPANFVPVGSSAGLAQDFGFGFNIGATYDFTNSGIDGLTVGAMYKSAISMTYDSQISNATKPFVALGIFPAAMSDKLEQPAEYGVGFSYEMGQHTFAFDYKKIKWSSADGYKDFGWDDSNVFAVGYQFSQDNWALRLGYNHASSAVVELNGNTPSGAAINFFNLLGFPATAENHYTIGGTYEFSQTFSADVAVTYESSSNKTFSLAALQGFSNYNPNEITTKHAETGITFQLNYKF